MAARRDIPPPVHVGNPWVPSSTLQDLTLPQMPQDEDFRQFARTHRSAPTLTPEPAALPLDSNVPYGDFHSMEPLFDGDDDFLPTPSEQKSDQETQVSRPTVTPSIDQSQSLQQPNRSRLAESKHKLPPCSQCNGDHPSPCKSCGQSLCQGVWMRCTCDNPTAIALAGPEDPDSETETGNVFPFGHQGTAVPRNLERNNYRRARLIHTRYGRWEREEDAAAAEQMRTARLAAERARNASRQVPRKMVSAAQRSPVQAAPQEQVSAQASRLKGRVSAPPINTQAPTPSLGNGIQRLPVHEQQAVGRNPPNTQRHGRSLNGTPRQVSSGNSGSSSSDDGNRNISISHTTSSSSSSSRTSHSPTEINGIVKNRIPVGRPRKDGTPARSSKNGGHNDLQTGGQEDDARHVQNGVQNGTQKGFQNSLQDGDTGDA